MKRGLGLQQRQRVGRHALQAGQQPVLRQRGQRLAHRMAVARRVAQRRRVGGRRCLVGGDFDRCQHAPAQHRHRVQPLDQRGARRDQVERRPHDGADDDHRGRVDFGEMAPRRFAEGLGVGAVDTRRDRWPRRWWFGWLGWLRRFMADRRPAREQRAAARGDRRDDGAEGRGRDDDLEVRLPRPRGHGLVVGRGPGARPLRGRQALGHRVEADQPARRRQRQHHREDLRAEDVDAADVEVAGHQARACGTLRGRLQQRALCAAGDLAAGARQAAQRGVEQRLRRAPGGDKTAQAQRGCSGRPVLPDDARLRRCGQPPQRHIVAAQRLHVPGVQARADDQAQLQLAQPLVDAVELAGLVPGFGDQCLLGAPARRACRVPRRPVRAGRGSARRARSAGRCRRRCRAARASGRRAAGRAAGRRSAECRLCRRC